MKRLFEAWMRHGKSRKGAMTLEATIALPFFMFAILSIAFISKVYYIHSQVQEGLNQAATEMSTYSYLYYKSGMQEGHDALKDGLDKWEKPAPEHMVKVMDTYASMQKNWEKTQEANTKLMDGDLNDTQTQYTEVYNTMKSDTLDLKQIVVDIKNKPEKELVSIISFLVNGGMEKLKTEGGGVLARYIMSKHVTPSLFRKTGIGAYIVSPTGEAFDAFDMDSSSIFADKKTIDLVAKYSVRVKLPIDFMPVLDIKQRATVKGWLDGDGSYSVPDTSTAKKSDTNYWELSPFERGKLITSEELAAKPDAAGEITEVRSIDLSAASYQKPENLVSILKSDLDKFLAKTSDPKITKRNFVVVFPEDSVTSKYKSVMDNEVTAYAKSKGITLTYKMAYGKPKTQGNESAAKNNILVALNSDQLESVFENVKETTETETYVFIKLLGVFK